MLTHCSLIAHSFNVIVCIVCSLNCRHEKLFGDFVSTLAFYWFQAAETRRVGRYFAHFESNIINNLPYPSWQSCKSHSVSQVHIFMIVKRKKKKRTKKDTFDKLKNFGKGSKWTNGLCQFRFTKRLPSPDWLSELADFISSIDSIKSEQKKDIYKLRAWKIFDSLNEPNISTESNSISKRNATNPARGFGSYTHQHWFNRTFTQNHSNELNRRRWAKTTHSIETRFEWIVHLLNTGKYIIVHVNFTL